MQVTYISEAMPGGVNDDFVVAGERFVVVLDGATQLSESGCVHGVPWLVGRLGVRLAAGMVSEGGASLRAVLAGAIEGVCALHEATCDLAHPNSPSSTVAMLRQRGESVEYLVLCDSPIAVETVDGKVQVVVDDATSHLPGYTQEDLCRSRNQPGGFWVASTKVEAAEQALTGCLEAADVRRVALMTDGVSRLVERYGWTWGRLMDLVEAEGPGAAVRAVREAERATAPGTYRGKVHDDVTIALCRGFGA
ncbi:protein phosphatase 2C domain-containing protein [Yinghuangia seranimata]|uniref:protein phosphatase 2C domain-containing protein n=1 Tax=Yinghuangia seranimata TaxID=408067 RepID=UPI00248C7D84|nr:protein phosphatase 2C domain-containing protein [Yinghuangia seranimata]MDI2126168.1 protein phosphatase 2C domain-containing protein [Yinghuangia seranimata]